VDLVGILGSALGFVRAARRCLRRSAAPALQPLATPAPGPNLADTDPEHQQQDDHDHEAPHPDGPPHHGHCELTAAYDGPG
jgi:hypothetical protein